jgi:hypothetical protein
MVTCTSLQCYSGEIYALALFSPGCVVSKEILAQKIGAFAKKLFDCKIL